MTSFILIDLENVQPKNLSHLNRGAYKIKVFHSAKQSKVPLEMASALQAFGRDAEYIPINGEGKNALDFHIAYYIGRLAAEIPGARFHVISGDTGFDTLIKHLGEQQISCQRWKSIDEIPLANGSSSASIAARLKAVIDDLIRRKEAKPATVKKLRGTINALHNKQLAAEDLDALVEELKQAGKIKVTDGKVQYHLAS